MGGMLNPASIPWQPAMADDDMQSCTRRARVRKLVVGSRSVRQIHTTILHNIAYKLGDVVSLPTFCDSMLEDVRDGDLHRSWMVCSCFSASCEEVPFGSRINEPMVWLQSSAVADKAGYSASREQVSRGPSATLYHETRQDGWVVDCRLRFLDPAGALIVSLRRGETLV